jgi:CBS domain-containing protein
MLEAGTANVHFLLPIVVTTCTAKLVGNLFGHEGVYEIGLRRKKLRCGMCECDASASRCGMCECDASASRCGMCECNVSASRCGMCECDASASRCGMCECDASASRCGMCECDASASRCGMCECDASASRARHPFVTRDAFVGLRFLQHESSWEMDLCTAADVMSRPPVTLTVVARVGDILDKLRLCEHHGFPVVSMTDEGDPSFTRVDPSTSLGDGLHDCKFEGLILRSQLLHILSARYGDDGPDPGALWYKVTAASLQEVCVDGEPVMYDLMAYNTPVTVAALSDLSDADRARWVNLGAYMNCASYTVLESCPLSRAYKLFREMGLRHLPVLDIQNRVVGMLARANFSEEALEHAVRAYYREEELNQQAHEVITPRLHGYQQVWLPCARARSFVSADGRRAFG